MPNPYTATTSNVAASTSSVALFASRSDGVADARMVQNDSTAVLYLKYGTAASATSYTVKLDPGAHYEFPKPLYDGVVHGIWSAADGAARCTEVA